MMLSNTIKKLIAILKEEGIDEIEVRRLWTTVRVARRTGGRSLVQTAAEPALDGVNAVPGEQAGDASSGVSDDGVFDKIVSPMVGTFYQASHPEAEPFVYEGKRIEPGEVLCVIEAMKLMNEIEADRSGIIRKILVRDSEPVEYGQPLFLVESA